MYHSSFVLACVTLLFLQVLAQDATTTYWEPSPPTNTPCSPLELVIARGTGEPGEYGFLVGDPLFNLTRTKIPDVTGYPVNYPANWTLGVSISIGANNTVAHLQEQSNKCPDQKYILIGYSQGALVIHSAVATGTELSDDFLKAKVLAFIVYGDPDEKGSGAPGAIDLLPDPLKTRFKSNCECGDAVCSAGTGFGVHASAYVSVKNGYHNQTSDYIKKAYDEDGAQGSSVFTSYDPSQNCTLQYCTNTTLAGAPPHSSGPLGICAANGTTSGNGTSSGSSISSAPLSTGTGSLAGSGGNSTSPAGTGSGTSGSSPPMSTGGSIGTAPTSPYILQCLGAALMLIPTALL